MRKKFLIIGLISLFLILGCLFIFVTKKEKKGENLPTELPPQSNDVQITPKILKEINYTEEEIKEQKDSCLKKSDSINEQDIYVHTIVKQVISETRMSEQYFNDHFKFVCGIPVYNGKIIEKTVLLFAYSIGDYSIMISFIDPISEYPIWFNGLHEIKNVISIKDAIFKLNECIEKNQTPYVKYSVPRLSPEGIFLDAFGKYWEGSLNLETGECKKAKHLIRIE